MKRKNDTSITSEIIGRLAHDGNFSILALDKLKRVVSKEESVALATNADLIAAYRKLLAAGRVQKNEQMESLLTVKRMRSESGVAIITVLTMPYPCPGRCIYCPDEERMPKSYIASEPAAARALALQFDPYAQVRRRIEMLEGNGHPSDKIELIIKGGTWSSYPVDYQQWFVKECFKAMNEIGIIKRDIDYTATTPYNRFLGDEKSTWTIDTLLAEQTVNETALHRCIGLTIETRPDFISSMELVRLRLLGVTRVELGVQTTDDSVLALTKRGHKAKHAQRATKLLKDAGFKTDYHLMPGLPGATIETDLACAREVFSNASYQPDMIKLYPTVVTPNTELLQWWKDGRYTPYSTSELIGLLAEIKTAVPPYVRISRVIRDIPSNETLAGNQKTNLRETVQKYMREHGMVCRCLRCREAGHKTRLQVLGYRLEVQSTLIEMAYQASDGKEYFLSFEDEKTDTVFAFLRMRFPSPETPAIAKHFPELKGAALIRELHTYGQLVRIDTAREDASQHKGYGKRLLARAEEIAKKEGYAKIAVIAGVGVREYYRRRGYSLEGTYMIKYFS